MNLQGQKKLFSNSCKENPKKIKIFPFYCDEFSLLADKYNSKALMKIVREQILLYLNSYLSKGRNLGGLTFGPHSSEGG